MIKLENHEVVGWEHAIRGMRNPMNSWDRSDSDYDLDCDLLPCEDCPAQGSENCTFKLNVGFSNTSIGPNDHELMMKLAKGGSVHAKYRRMITVYVDITAPLYWWKEFDTYKVGTVANSCSTMHKIHDKEFTLDDFSCEHLIYGPDAESFELEFVDNDNTVSFSPGGVLRHVTIPILNRMRQLYLDTKNKKYWWQMIQLLPSSYNQKRTVMLNYEVLTNIYESRKNHKLDEWREFCNWIEQLPYSEIITGEVKDE